MNVKEIVTKYLQDNGYDGLWIEDTECCCTIEDLMDCEEINEECQPGYKKNCAKCELWIDGECEEGTVYCVGPEKEVA